ncbi:hypothetical protein QE449_002729 [Rhodococcus sp. SORGH_AS303]|nr:hypothetical protein [Rhodococcus sp. SORGH_AS_0303]
MRGVFHSRALGAGSRAWVRKVGRGAREVEFLVLSAADGAGSRAIRRRAERGVRGVFHSRALGAGSRAWVRKVGRGAREVLDAHWRRGRSPCRVVA